MPVRRSAAAAATSPPVVRARLDVDARRRQLLALGTALFGSRPYDEVSIDEVARTAGISKGLLYHYFPTKRDFYVATVREAAAELVEPNQDVRADGSARSAPQRSRRILRLRRRARCCLREPPAERHRVGHGGRDESSTRRARRSAPGSSRSSRCAATSGASRFAAGLASSRRRPSAGSARATACRARRCATW